MGRLCVICKNGLAGPVRTLAKQFPGQPGSIIAAIERTHGVKLTVWNLRRHAENHDSLAGTPRQMRFIAEKKVREAEAQMDQAKKIAGNVIAMAEKFTSWQSDLSVEDFLKMRPMEQVAFLRLGKDILFEAKDMELKQRKMQQDENLILENWHRAAASTALKRPDPLVAGEPDGD